MIDEQRYRALIQQLATGGIAGNKTYHQVRDQYMPMDSESMGYMNGGGIGSMMQPRRNFKLGGGEFEEDQTIGLQNIINSGLSENENTDVAFKPGSALDTQINKLNTLEQMGFPQPNLKNLKEMDMKQFNENGTPLSLSPELYASANNIMSDASKIDVNDLTNRNNKNFLISAANALNDQTGIIDSAPSITNDGVRTMEGSLIDGDDPSSRYAVQQDFKSDRPFDRDFSLFDKARMGNSNQIPDRNRGQIIERNPSAPFNRATINEIAGPSTIDRFSNTVGPVPNVEAVYQDKIMGGLEGDPNPYNFSQNFDQSYDASSDKNVPGMGIREIDFIDAPADGIFTKNNIAKGLIDKNITNRAFNKGTPEATAEFLAANNFPIPENLKQFLEVDTATGKYTSKKSPNNFMTFMSNIPTPLNLARKTFSALGNANSAFNKKMRGINEKTGLANTQAQYEANRDAASKQRRTDNMIDRINEGKSFRSNPRDAGTTKAQKDAISASLRESRRGNQYSNDSPGSGGKSIVCTAMYQTTGLQDWAKAMKVWYIYQKRHLSDAHQEGYHLLFKPFVKGMHKSKIIRAIGAHVAKHRTQELKHIMFNSKSDTLGKIYNNILEPICYLAGKIKSIFKK